jgi:hypothetical protein
MDPVLDITLADNIISSKYVPVPVRKIASQSRKKIVFIGFPLYFLSTTEFGQKTGCWT